MNMMVAHGSVAADGTEHPLTKPAIIINRSLELAKTTLSYSKMSSTLHPRGFHRVIVELRGLTLIAVVKSRQKLNFYDPGDSGTTYYQ